VFVGAEVSSRTTTNWLRPILAAVLLASALKLLDAPSVATGIAAFGVGVVLLLLPWILRRLGVPERAAPTAARETSPRAHLSEV
jgi:uncharacterized protein